MENLGEWYSDIVKKAELADYGPNKGDIVIRPYGMAIWNAIIRVFSEKINSQDYYQAYFPLLIPQSFIEAETSCMESLSPRMFSASKWGEEESSEKLVIRATSETIINHMFSKWVESYRDLPLKLYQVSNILRWEEVTHPFIKGREIQWIEGHAIFESQLSAHCDIADLSKIFLDFYQNTLAIPVCSGEEPQTRKFVGSERTITFETIVRNSKSLQLGAIYDLGKIFSNIFSVQYRTEKNELEHCWGVNWGIGFRLVGALALVHGDERGLKLPPQIAPIQLVLLPIVRSKVKNDELMSYVKTLKDKFCESGIRATISTQKFSTVKEAISYWETRGIPLILPIGTKETETHSFCLVRRDRGIENNKYSFSESELVKGAISLLKEIQEDMYIVATQQMENKKTNIENQDVANFLNSNWGLLHWCGESACEQNILDKYGKIFKCILPEDVSDASNCSFCGKKAYKKIMIAKTY